MSLTQNGEHHDERLEGALHQLSDHLPLREQGPSPVLPQDGQPVAKKKVGGP